MQNYSLLIIVGVSLFSGLSAAGQDSTVVSGSRQTGNLKPLKSVSENVHRVVLRAPAQLVSTSQQESNPGEDPHVGAGAPVVPTVEAPGRIEMVPDKQWHAGGARPVPVHACVQCAEQKSTPVRRLFDRVASGFDYVFLGVTAAKSGAGKATNCDCDHLDSCDASIELGWAAPEAFQQPACNRTPQA